MFDPPKFYNTDQEIEQGIINGGPFFLLHNNLLVMYWDERRIIAGDIEFLVPCYPLVFRKNLSTLYAPPTTR